MAISHDVKLVRDTSGQDFSNWSEYQITLDMLKAGSPWSFTLWRSDAASSTWNDIRKSIKCGHAITVSIDGAPQLNGRVEEIVVGGNRQKGVSFTITGRDMAGGPIDWDVDPSVSLRNTTLEDALTAILTPFGITVVLGADASAARNMQSSLQSGSRAPSTRHHRRQQVDLTHPRIGERAWALCEKLARKEGFMLWIAPDTSGNLAAILDAPAYSGVVDYDFRRVEQNGVATGNVIDGSLTVQTRDTPTDVFVYSRAARGNKQAARYAAHVQNARFDTQFVVPPQRASQPRHIRADRARSVATATQEAQRALSDAMVHHRTYQGTVQGHGQVVNETMTLYAINSICHIQDDEALLDDTMLISRVQFSRSRAEGVLTRFVAHTLGAIVATPEQQ